METRLVRKFFHHRSVDGICNAPAAQDRDQDITKLRGISYRLVPPLSRPKPKPGRGDTLQCHHAPQCSSSPICADET